MENKCPQCGLLNPPSAHRCDCGYDLVKRPEVSGSRITVRLLLFSFEGRIGRYKYWLFFLAYAVIYGGLLLLDRTLGTFDSSYKIGVFSGIFQLLTLYPSIAVAVKRCHDRGRTGWFLLVGIIPVLNLWLLMELGFLPGTVGPNKFGLPEPGVG